MMDVLFTILSHAWCGVSAYEIRITDPVFLDYSIIIFHGKGGETFVL
jgi:hypothetical protein